MMDSFSAPGRSVSRLNVSLRSTNSASEQNILIENAHVRWEIRLGGLSYILYEWRLTSFLIVMCCCVAIQGSAFGVLVAVLSAIVREREMELEDEIDESVDQYVVFEREAREPLFHPLLTYTTQITHPNS